MNTADSAIIKATAHFSMAERVIAVEGGVLACRGRLGKENAA
jgi:hypothetical protein